MLTGELIGVGVTKQDINNHMAELKQDYELPTSTKVLITQLSHGSVIVTLEGPLSLHLTMRAKAKEGSWTVWMGMEVQEVTSCEWVDVELSGNASMDVSLDKSTHHHMVEQLLCEKLRPRLADHTDHGPSRQSPFAKPL